MFAQSVSFYVLLGACEYTPISTDFSDITRPILIPKAALDGQVCVLIGTILTYYVKALADAVKHRHTTDLAMQQALESGEIVAFTDRDLREFEDRGGYLLWRDVNPRVTRATYEFTAALEAFSDEEAWVSPFDYGYTIEKAVTLPHYRLFVAQSCIDEIARLVGAEASLIINRSAKNS